ncbi:MAG: M23 family metallopeptidase [Firmicutes bacterium]|nr:M23 family metallopeptidase [Bacillota bacterium]
MKKRLVLKPFVIPTVYSILVVALVVGIFVSLNKTPEETEESEYVSGTILDEYVPVINNQVQEATIQRPYLGMNVTIGKNFYDKNDSEEEQRNSIIYHENTYIQNTGIDYQQAEVFEVISVLDGEVIDVSDKELLGKSVTIRHNNEVISVYQSLSEVNVNKGDHVSISQIIGKSGTCELNKELNNHLHFELSIKGQLVDPENYYGKKLSEV